MTSGEESAAKADVEAPPSTESRGKAALGTAAAAAVATKKRKLQMRGGWKRGLAIFDFILRLSAIAAALGAATAMGTSGETLPFFTQFFQFQATYNDLPTFTLFVVGNAIASGYLVLSLPFSIVGIVRPTIVGVRLLLLIFDTVMVALTTASTASATAIVYLAHNGNSSANWIAICQQFNDFCQRISGAVVASSIAAFIFILLVIISAMILRKH